MRLEPGLAFLVPSREGAGGVGVLARYQPPIGLGYFFARADPQGLDELRADAADLVCQFGDLGLIGGSWKVLGPLPGFTRAAWPLPPFGQHIEIAGVALRIEFLGDDLDTGTRETRVDPEEIAGLPRIGIYGAGAVEAVLGAT